MYSERLLEHFRNPRGVGELPPPAVVAEAANPACGDTLRISVRFEQDRVTEARFLARGCTASVAAGSVLAEWLVGKHRAELAGLQPEVIAEALGGLAPESRHAAVLAVDAARAVAKSR